MFSKRVSISLNPEAFTCLSQTLWNPLSLSLSLSLLWCYKISVVQRLEFANGALPFCIWIFLISIILLQLRVHCAEALGTPIVGDYKYGWFVHQKWKQMPRVDIEPTTGKPYKLRRPDGLDVQKGSVLSKVPLLHLHCRELVLPNIAKFIQVLDQKSENLHPAISSKPDLFRFVASMPNHMKISWNLMSSYLV